jgi:hypothetical protein
MIGTNLFNCYIVTVKVTLLVTIITNTFCNLLLKKKRKQPNFSKMRNDVTVTIFGGQKKREQCNRYNFLRGQDQKQ